MEIIKNIQVPTGNICIGKGEKGSLEFLCIGDYGKNENIKADFLGITRELNGVPNGEIMPLSEKMVITISTQYGCSMDCKFCDVPKVGKGINATLLDLNNQIIQAIKLNPEVKETNRLNIHYARMGEPTFNPYVLENAKSLPGLIEPYLCKSLIHPVISTMMPRNNKNLTDFLMKWGEIKNEYYNGDAGLQFSINSTDDSQREVMFSGNALTLDQIAYEACFLPKPKGRKYALNFALADEYIIDAKRLRYLFNPEYFMCKITPLHKTKSCEDNNITTTGGYEAFTPYKKVERDLIDQGFDVIVFVPSYDEDGGLITCGNAILSGNLPSVKYTELK